MLKIIKWLAGLFVTLTLLILLAIIIIPNVIDPNDYRDDLSALVKEQTGRDLNLSGDLKISVFPWLGVKTQGLSLSQPEGIDGDMLSVGSAQLRVKFSPLLSKRIEVDTVVLERPMIKLVTLKSGLDSFSGLSEDAPEEVQEDSATAAVALAIQGIELTDGIVVIDDRQEGSVLELSNLNVVTGNLIGSSLADITATGQLTDSTSPDVTTFDLNAKALIDSDTYAVQVQDLLAQIQYGEFDIDLGLEELAFRQSSQLEASGLNIALNGEHEVQALAPKIVANLDAQTASVDTLSVNYQNVQAVVSNLKAKDIIDQPSATGTFSIIDFDARDLIKALEIDFQPSDSQVLKSVAINADFAGSLDGALVRNLVVNLDQTALTGSASVVNFEKPKLKFDLNLTDLNLDLYLPEDTEEEEEEVSGGEALAVPMALFKDIDANGTFKASKLISGGVALSDIDVVVKSTPGNVSITPRASLYEGKLDGAIVFNESGEKSSLTVKNEIDLVQLSPLLNDAIDSDQLRGIGTLALDLVVTELNGVQSNQGTIELRAKEGAVSGIDLVTKTADLINNFSPSREPESEQTEIKGSKSDNTEFSELLGTFYLKDFLMTNDDLKLNGPGFEITGAGQFNLEKESIDYRVKLTVLEGVTKLGGDGVQALLGKVPKWAVGKQIPIRCRGTFDSPVCLPDLKQLWSLYATSKINDKKAELVQEKLGIKTEEGKKVRTKDIFKQLILKEVLDDDEAQESEVQERSESREIPIGERDAEPTAEEGQDSAEPIREKTKKELRDERKRKLLESIFK